MISNPSMRALSTNTSFEDPAPGNLPPSTLVVKYEYVNYTGRDIFIRTQSNIPMVIAPTKKILAARPHSHLEVRTTYSLQCTDAFAKTKNLIENIESNNIVLSAAAKNMLEKLNEETRRNPYIRAHHNFTMTTFLHIEDHEIDNGGSVYSRECDLVLSFYREGILAPHPNSNEGFNQLALDKTKDLHGFSGTFVRVIDNERLTPSWFYYSGKRVVEVPSVRDEMKESGVYVSVSSMEEGVLKVKSEFMSFDQAFEKIGLCRTQSEALQCGNLDEQAKIEALRLRKLEQDQKTELLKQQHILEQMRQENERAKHEQAMLQLAHERELNVLKSTNAAQKEIIDMAAQRRDHGYKEKAVARDDFYDRKKKKRQEKSDKSSATMKFIGETLKYVPAITAACIGTWAIMRQRDG